MDLIERDVRAMITFDLPIDVALRIKNRVVLGLDADSLDFITSTDSLTPGTWSDRAVRHDVRRGGLPPAASIPDDKDLLEVYRRESFGVDDKPFEGGQFVFLHDRVKPLRDPDLPGGRPDADSVEDWNVQQDETEKIGLPARLEIELTLELAPRIQREQVIFKSVDKRTITYTRILRFSEDVLAQLEIQPMPVVPNFAASQQQQQGGGGGATQQQTGGGGFTNGGGGGGGRTGGNSSVGTTRGASGGGAAGSPQGGGGKQ
jgi:hypothetical protein